MLLVPVEEGRRREGEERAAVAVNFLEVGGGRYSQPQVLLVLEPRCLLDAAGLVVPSHRSQTPGWGREEAGAAASYTVRARGRGGSGGRCVCVCVWPGGRRPREGKAGAKAQVLLIALVCLFPGVGVESHPS